MRNKTLLIGVFGGIVIGVLLSTAVVFAGSLNPAAGPGSAGSQMFTLQQIYDRLTNGAAGTKMTTFTEPATGPSAGTMRTLDEVMAAAPAVDATNGATTANVASGKTFWGLTSGQWGLQTGTGSIGGTYNAGVPRTGQTTSYAAGDDGALQRGVAWPNPRFTDNSNGTVTDNLTGLIWLKNANCFGLQTWANALSAANTLNSGECGLSDGSAEGAWRLPNVREQQSLIDYGRFNPALPSGHPFTGVQTATYWTSTARADLTSHAWGVTLNFGVAYNTDKTSAFNVWPVRGGQ
jgi:hypothetical protein